MQYITQCPTTRDVITTSLWSNNYLLSQIVKEQPIDASRRNTKQSRLPRDWLLFPSRARAGGANRDRTGDLLLAKQALSQLSYGPAAFSNRLVGLDGVEPS